MRGHPDSDVDPQTEERLDAEPEHGMGFGLLTEALIEDGLIGPFPQEPAPGSPEAVAEAARVIAALLFVNGMGQEAMAKDGCRERHLGEPAAQRIPDLSAALEALRKAGR